MLQIPKASQHNPAGSNPNQPTSSQAPSSKHPIQNTHNKNENRHTYSRTPSPQRPENLAQEKKELLDFPPLDLLLSLVAGLGAGYVLGIGRVVNAAWVGELCQAEPIVCADHPMLANLGSKIACVTDVNTILVNALCQGFKLGMVPFLAIRSAQAGRAALNKMRAYFQ
jgi:hypothetical protein